MLACIMMSPSAQEILIKIWSSHWHDIIFRVELVLICWIVHSFLGLLLRHLLFSFACYYDNNNVRFTWLISLWILVDEIISYLSFVLFCFCVIHFISCMYFPAVGNQSLFCTTLLSFSLWSVIYHVFCSTWLLR